MIRERKEAEVVADTPDRIVEQFVALGFEVKVIDWPDGVTIVATTFTALEDDDFFRYVNNLVAPLGGTLMQVGPAEAPGRPHDVEALLRRYDRFRGFIKAPGATILEFGKATKAQIPEAPLDKPDGDTEH